jgi:Mrp family chromosome partitioning ATPase/predicted Fe-Mo cluster-binding NifX family protein
MVTPAQDPQERARIMAQRKENREKRMSRIKHKLVVLSGKGGVGKSTVAAYLATALASEGRRVGLLDTDIHGPSIPKILGLEGKRIEVRGNSVIPIEIGPNLVAMSIAFLLRDKTDAVIWRGPMKMNMIEEFLANVEWGDLDYLIIDSPPGTGDEPLSVCQLIPDIDGAVVVATPQDIAIADVEKSITFCRQVKLPVLGVVENMSGFICPHCGKAADVFKTGGAARMAERMGVPFLGRIPMVPEVVSACDEGHCYIARVESEDLRSALRKTAAGVLERVEARASGKPESAGAPEDPEAGSNAANGDNQTGDLRKIALPLDGDRLSTHFGHSSAFAIYEVAGGRIVGEKREEPPAHAPGVLPGWLRERGVDVVLAVGMGSRAMSMFEEAGIEVVSGAPSGTPREVVGSYLQGTLAPGENVCDH